MTTRRIIEGARTEGARAEDRFATFRVFEASLSDDQRQLLLRHPDILNPELVVQLYQASLERFTAENAELTTLLYNNEVEEFREPSTKKRRKMVNSWMTFRSYYSPLIRDLPQKARSPLLALLWKHDVDHGLWELLSATFNYIRDNHSEDGVTIDKFLAIAAQVVPIVPVDQYFGRCGWVRVGDVLKQSKMLPKELPKVTNLSCAGVSHHCFRQGLISVMPALERADSRTTSIIPAAISSISFASTASVSSSSLNKNPMNNECCAQTRVGTDEEILELNDPTTDTLIENIETSDTDLEQPSEI